LAQFSATMSSVTGMNISRKRHGQHFAWK